MKTSQRTIGLQTFLGLHICCLHRDCLLLGRHEKTAHKFPEDVWTEYVGEADSEKANNDWWFPLRTPRKSETKSQLRGKTALY